MAKRQVNWARRKRSEILVKLGCKCAACGKLEELELDCIVPQGHTHHAAGYTARTSFYNQQLKLGNLQILCEKCHRVKTARDLAADAHAPAAPPISFPEEEHRDDNTPF